MRGASFTLSRNAGQWFTSTVRCAPLTVSLVYATMDRLEREARVCPYSLDEARRKLARIEERRHRRDVSLIQRRGVRIDGRALAG